MATKTRPGSDTKLVRYVYLDVVSFTQDRSVEAQIDIVQTLNRIVRSAIKSIRPEHDVLLIPSGDGICIAITEPDAPNDVHLRVALKILARVAARNARCADKMRRFNVRIGVNQNEDSPITDINGHPNIAGAGVNDSQRIMQLADGSQILVGQGVFHALGRREKYIGAFHELEAIVKHGTPMRVYQYRALAPGLSRDLPSAFAPKKAPDLKLSRLQAFYLAHAVENRTALEELGSLIGSVGYSATVILFLMAADSLDELTSTPGLPPSIRVKPEYGSTFGDRVRHLGKQEFWVLCSLSDFIVRWLKSAESLFETCERLFVSEVGKQKLLRDHPDVWQRVLGEPLEPGEGQR